MEDSSSNPYIPQESQTTRQQVYNHQSPLGRIVKMLLITTIVVAVLVGGGLFFVVPMTTAVDSAARTKLADVLQPPEQTLKRVAVKSDVGFQLNYDNRVYSSYAEVGDSTAGTDESVAVLSGQTYENNDLRVTRAYNYVRIRPVESVESSRALSTLPPELEVFATTSDAELDEASKLTENKDLSKLSLFVKLDGDKRAAERVADDKTFVTIEATKASSATINNVEYQRVRYTTTNENYRISNVKQDDCYYTIQFAQPYSICISNVRPTNVSAASLVEQVFDSISFEQSATSGPAVEPSDKTSFAHPLVRLIQATDDDANTDEADDQILQTTTGDEASNTGGSTASGESDLITITPEYYSDGATLQSIAKSQPSVVRVGTLFCADLALKFEDGETATTLSDACVGKIGSGVFISNNGYIATTGHAIRTELKAAINGYINFAPDRELMLDRLQRILDYLLEAKIILESDAEYLKTGASTGDQEALAKIMNIGSIIPDNYITPVKEEYTYAIQPYDKPIVVNRSDTFKPSFAYSDSVLEAEFVGAEYEPKKSVQYVFGSDTPQKDVGLLKVSGTFPEVPIASDDEVKADDVLSTIGFTAYTDSTLTIDKIRDLPIVTVSHVEQAYQKEGTSLIQTNMPILPGNDGAPVFNNKGELIGFAVYGLLYCPDQLCFASGTVRSTSELKRLLKDENVSLPSMGELATSWRGGVDQFFASNYSASTASFASGSDYRFNRWAKPLNQLSSSLQGSNKDTSLWNQLLVIMIVALVSLVVATILLAILHKLYQRRISMLQTGHYGAAAASAPVQAPVSAPMYGPTPTPPAESIPGAVNPTGPVMPQQPPVNNQPPVGGVQPTPPTNQGPEDPFYRQ